MPSVIFFSASSDPLMPFGIEEGPSVKELPAIDPLTRRPSSDRYGQILYPRRAIFVAVNQRVRQVFFVIAFREVCSLMRATRFLAMQRGLNNGLGDVEHVGKLDRRGQVSVERVTAVLDGDVTKELL